MITKTYNINTIDIRPIIDSTLNLNFSFFVLKYTELNQNGQK